MGLFNGLSTVNRINGLLRDLENQVTITQGQIESGAPKFNLQNSLNVHKRIHQNLIDAFGNSRTAQVSMYKVFGDNMRMHDILSYSKNLIYNLNSIIQNY